MEDADRLEVELVGVLVGLGDAELVEDAGEPSDARPDRLAEPQPHGVGDLLAQVLGRLAHERERAVEEGGMLDAVVGERLEAAAKALGSVARLFVNRVEQRVDLGEVARRGQRKELLLGGKMPVDDCLIDPGATGDAVDAGILRPALVEQRAGRVDDLALAGPP